MQKQLHALCLSLCVTLLSACSGHTINEAPPIVKNEVPAKLLVCKPEPEKMDFNTGDPKRDFQNIVAYAAKTKAAGADCRSKLQRTRGLLNQT